MAPFIKKLASPWSLFVSAVIIAPFAEELFFRGFVFGGLRKRYDWRVAAAISAAIFAAFHLEPLAFIPLFAVGFFLAYLYHRYGSLWPGMILHACINGLAVLSYFVALHYL